MQYPSIQAQQKVPDANSLSTMLARMPDQSLQQYAAMHKDDPYTMSLAFAESNRRKQMRAAAEQHQQEQPKVVDQALQSMAQLPEDSGIAQLPVQNMQNMAEGGIVGYDEFNYAGGGGPLTDNYEPRMAGGGMVAFANGGGRFGNAGEGQSDPVDVAIQAEGISDPEEIAFIKAIYHQESSSGKNVSTSNRGAVGHMQVTPIAFKDVNVDNALDPSNKYDMARAGVRYAVKGFNQAGRDPVLGGAFYYGGPGAMKAAAEGKSRKDKKNPDAPDTLTYGKSIASLMTKMLPMASANAAQPAAPKSQGAIDDEIVKAFPDLLSNPHSPAYARAAEASGLTGLQLEMLRRKQAQSSGVPKDDVVQNVLRFGTASQNTEPARGVNPDAANAETQSLLSRHPVPATPSSRTGFGGAGVDPSVMAPGKGLNMPAAAAAQAAKAKEESGSSFSQDDWLRLGLGLLGSKSPHWQHALSEAGESVLSGRDKAAARAAAERKQKMEEKLYGAHARYYDANAAAALSGEKTIAALEKQTIADATKAWKELMENDPKYFTVPAEQKLALRDQMIAESLRNVRRSQYNEALKQVPAGTDQYFQ
jgi:hypothetical protein